MTAATALIVIDVQKGFDDPFWGAPNNPDAEPIIALLLEAWRTADQPVVLVRHDSHKPGSPLAAATPGNSFATNLHGGGFARVATTKEVLADL